MSPLISSPSKIERIFRLLLKYFGIKLCSGGGGTISGGAVKSNNNGVHNAVLLCLFFNKNYFCHMGRKKRKPFKNICVRFVSRVVQGRGKNAKLRFVIRYSSIVVWCLVLGVCLLFLGGCSQAPQKDYATMMLPVPPVNDPSDQILKQAVTLALKKNRAPAFSKYDFKRYDLNGDGRRDGLVFLKNPYGYWCNIYGCTMLVFKAHDKKFTFMGHIQPVREPVYITQDRTNGWHNLVVRVSGRSSRAKNVILRHNGRGYPVDPEGLPAAAYKQGYYDERIFYE